MTRRTTAISDSMVVSCPYCGHSEEVEMDFEPGEQRYIEDCEVCCQPWEMTVVRSRSGAVTVRLVRMD